MGLGSHAMVFDRRKRHPLPQSAGPVLKAPGGAPFSGRSIFNGRPGGRTGERDMEGNARLSGRYLHMSEIGMRQGRVHRRRTFGMT